MGAKTGLTKNEKRQKLALWDALVEQGESVRAAAQAVLLTTTTLYTWRKSGLRLTGKMRDDARDTARTILSVRKTAHAKRRQAEVAAKARDAKAALAANKGKSTNGEMTAVVLERVLRDIASLNDVASQEKVRAAHEVKVDEMHKAALAEVDKRFSSLK